MSSEDWQTILQSMQNAEESQIAKKEAKDQEQVDFSEERRFIEEVSEKEFYPLLVDLRDNIPAIQAAKHKRIVKNIEHGKAFLCLLWGEKIGMEKTERAKLVPFLHKLIEFQNQAEKAKEKYAQGAPIFKALFSGHRYPQPEPISMYPPTYREESIPFLDCSYFCIELKRSGFKDEFSPYNPTLIIAGKEYPYVTYVKNKEDIFADIGRYLHTPFHTEGFLAPNRLSARDDGYIVGHCSPTSEEKIAASEDIPGVLIENILGGKSLTQKTVVFGLRNFDCYSSCFESCN